MAKKPAKKTPEAAPATDAAGDAAGAVEAKGLNGVLRNKKFLMIAGGGVVAVALIAGGVAFSLGLFSRPAPAPAPAIAGAPGGEPGPVARPRPHFMDLPEMTVNLTSTPQRPQFLRLRVSLELQEAAAAAAIQPMMPRVLDAFQTFLREMRPSDLEGSAAVHRLKEELTRRVNLAVAPTRVDAVLFRELLVQ